MIKRLLLVSLFSACANVNVEDELARQDVWHAAKLRGVAFRAVGQEPGWLLEIAADSILLSTDYGANKVIYDYVEPIVDQPARRTQYSLSDNTVIVINGIACTDVMSGEQFEVSVTIRQPDKELKGCGRALF